MSLDVASRETVEPARGLTVSRPQGTASFGRCLARELAAAGCHLALGDVDRAAAQEVADLYDGAPLSSGGIRRATAHETDVRDPASLDDLAEAVRQADGGGAVLINNAGVTLSGLFSSQVADDIDWLVNVNVRGVMQSCRAFLPLFREASGAMW